MPKESPPKPRRPGSIQTLAPGRYQVRVSWRDAGSQRSASRVVRGTETDAQAALADLLRVRERRPQPGAHGRLDEFMIRWAAGAPGREATRAWRSRILYTYVYPVLGTRPVGALTPADIERWTAWLDARGLSGATRRHIFVQLRAGLTAAVRAGLLGTHPMADQKPPRASHEEMKVLTHDECRLFLATLETAPPEQCVLLSLALATGMRPEEYLALTWGTVDLSLGFLTVRRALDPQGRFQEVKTPASRRMLPIGNNLWRKLEAMQKLQPAAPGRDDLVFHDEGRPLAVRRVRRWLQRILVAANLPIIRLYDLRHTCATLLLIRGVNPKVVSEWLGHASVAITLGTYSHVTPGLRASAMRALEEVLFDA